MSDTGASPRPRCDDRLGVVDEIFLRTHRGLGTPIALQGLWRTADRVDPALLAAVHTALRGGPLGRRVIRPRVPGARRRWQPTVRAYPLTYPNRPIPTDSLLEWADAQGHDLDPEFGPGWRLAATALDDGGSVVALTCSHALADGRALVIAVDRALATKVTMVEPDRSIGFAEESSKYRWSSHSVAPVSDWADARRQWSIVLRGTVRALRSGIPRVRTPVRRRHEHDDTDRRTHGDIPDRGAPDADRVRTGAPGISGVVVQCRAADWDRVAESGGGTANSLFIWLVANIVWASGFPGPSLDASIPVDTRDEPRVDNDLAMTEIAVTRADTPATIRDKARAAYEYRMSTPGGMPEELLQVIPDRWAYALSKGAGERDILCSNIGPLPDSLRTLGPHPCVGVAARAIHPGLIPDRLPRTRLSGYLCRSATDYVLSLVSTDPTRIPTAAVLRDLVGTVTAPLPLATTPW
ncbi:hypothetical protein [Nocardia sp. NPDC050710]|uniref:hypothetical protein n=1 Tax=Nocardia sp. NPDC050710 TaxID=3157220 RepID=UPI0033FC6C71